MKSLVRQVGQRFMVGFEGLTASADVKALIREISFKRMEAAEGRVKQLQERFLGGYRDPDPKQARLAAGRGEARALAESIANGSGLPA